MNYFCSHLGVEIQSFTAFDIFKIKITNMAASGRVVRRRYPDRPCARRTTTDLRDLTWTVGTIY